MGDLAGAITALGGAVAAILGAFALVLRQQRINNRATRREIQLLWDLVQLQVRSSRQLRLVIEDEGIPIPASVLELDRQIDQKRDALNADLLEQTGVTPT